MYRGFNLTLNGDTEFFSRFEQAGQTFMTNAWPKVKPTYALLDAEIISADEVMEEWFKQVDADVFISHSHADKDLALGLAGYLRSKLGLRPFIDSLIWEDSDKLLLAIDKKYCMDDNDVYFDYNKRNYSTSHVRMMLASSLTEAIDRSECILFLNTPSSIKVSDAKERASEKTASPWIYHELNVSRLIRQRPTNRPVVGFKSEPRISVESAAFEYTAHLGHLTPLVEEDILAWADHPVPGSAVPLDILYALHPARLREIPPHE